MPKTKRDENGGKRYPLNMRTTKATRDRLEKAAAESGRSMAQEVEFRLECSFWEEGLVKKIEAMLQKPRPRA